MPRHEDASDEKDPRTIAREKLPKGATVLAIKQAEKHSDVALVKDLWKITYFLAKAEALIAYTSKEAFANLCHDTFGWAVEREEGWTYKYSKCIDKEWLLDWINPETASSAMHSWDPYNETNQEAEKRWAACYVQKGLWFASIIRRPVADSNKDGPLDIESYDSLLPRGDARALLNFNERGIPEDIMKWIKRSAEEGPTATPSG